MNSTRAHFVAGTRWHFVPVRPPLAAAWRSGSGRRGEEARRIGAPGGRAGTGAGAGAGGARD